MNRLKRILFPAGMFLVCTAVAAFGQSAETLTVGINQNPPLVFMDDSGSARGIAIDILEYVAKTENWDITYRPGTWAECLQHLYTGKIDILPAIAFSEERVERLDFNKEPLISNWAQIYTSSQHTIDNFMDFYGKRVAVVTDDIYYHQLRFVDRYLKIEPVFIEVANYKTVLQRVADQTVDAGIVPRIFGDYHDKAFSIVKSPINFSPTSLHYAVRKYDHPRVIESIDHHLINLKQNQNSRYYKSIDYWQHGIRRLAFPKWLKPIWVMAGVAGFISIILLLNFILRWQVKSRTKALEITIGAKEKIETELRVAHEIQMDLLPGKFPPFPHRHEFDIHAIIKPAKHVGGDFYDFFLIDDNHLCIVIGDVSDKGVPAALFMARAKTLIKSMAHKTVSPGNIMNFVNKHLSDDNDALMFATAFCAVLTIDSGDVVYTNAGHNPPIITVPGESCQFLKPTGSTALGIDSGSIYTELSFNITPNACLLMYTDGVTEAFNKQKEIFSEQRLVAAVSANSDACVKDMVLSIMESVTVFSNESDQSDDIAILGLKYLQ